MTTLAVVPPLPADYIERPFPAREGLVRQTTVIVYDSPTIKIRIHNDGRHELRCAACDWLGTKPSSVASHYGRSSDAKHPVVTPDAKEGRAARRRPMDSAEYDALMLALKPRPPLQDFSDWQPPRASQPAPNPPVEVESPVEPEVESEAPPEASAPPEDVVTLRGEALAVLRAAVDSDGRTAELELELAQVKLELQQAKARYAQLQAKVKAANDLAASVDS